MADKPIKILNAYNIRNEIKSVGGKWNARDKAWEVNEEQHDKLQKLAESKKNDTTWTKDFASAKVVKPGEAGTHIAAREYRATSVPVWAQQRAVPMVYSSEHGMAGDKANRLTEAANSAETHKAAADEHAAVAANHERLAGVRQNFIDTHPESIELPRARVEVAERKQLAAMHKAASEKHAAGATAVAPTGVKAWAEKKTSTVEIEKPRVQTNAPVSSPTREGEASVAAGLAYASKTHESSRTASNKYLEAAEDFKKTGNTNSEERMLKGAIGHADEAAKRGSLHAEQVAKDPSKTKEEVARAHATAVELHQTAKTLIEKNYRVAENTTYPSRVSTNKRGFAANIVDEHTRKAAEHSAAAQSTGVKAWAEKKASGEGDFDESKHPRDESGKFS